MQKINLLHDFKTKTILLPAKQIFQIFLAVLSVLIIISLWQWGQLAFKYKELNSEQAKADGTEAAFYKLTTTHPIVSKHHSLKKTINELKNRLAIDKLKYETLSQQLLKSGFSYYMALLAEKSSSNISLDTIFISHVKRNITLYGKAKAANDVSQMIKNLYLSSLLKGTIFKQYILTKKNPYIEFEVATSKLINEEDILAKTFKEGKIQQQLLRNSR